MKQRKTLSLKEKLIYNEAINRACGEIKLYDGVIPDDVTRNYMAFRIKEELSYVIPEKYNEKRCFSGGQ